MHFLYKKNLFYLLLFILIPLSQCKKNDDPIPYVYVNFYVNLNAPQFYELTSVGGWVYVTGGFRGIVIYRNSIDEFSAYDRACPFKPSNECERIDVEATGVTAIDSCCGSRFLLIDGSVVNGPATISLKSYKTYLSGMSLQVSNY